uniref:Uncharacterized protein n=1 Tax=Panagrolaimus superbus TaxID=310955 RepID=A0A914Z1U9_9BILA
MRNISKIIVFLLCIKIVTGIKCVYSGNTGESHPECRSKYCYSIHLSGELAGQKGDKIEQGCGAEITADIIHPYKAQTCDEHGNGKQTYNQNGLHAELYCCDTDLCNSATSIKIILLLQFFHLFFL